MSESYAGKINRKLLKKRRIINAAAGREPSDLVLKNATYVNVFSNELCHADIAVAEGLIVGMGQYSGTVEEDCTGKIVLPGFLDAHIHLESSLVSPKEFVKAVLPHGTTTVITDPHEIANVMGTDGIEYMLQATEDLPVDVRFIEFMPMGSDTLWSPENFWPASDIRAAVEQHVRLVPLGDANEGQRGPARMFALEGGKGRMGFITPLTNHFCLSCNRLRLTSDGHLRTCLFADREYPLRPLLRHPKVTDEHIARVIAQACKSKPVGADLLAARQGGAVASSKMVSIGG